MRLLSLLSTLLITALLITAADARTRSRVDANGNKSTTSRECLTYDTRVILERAESHFGVKFKIESTCREGATIRGTSHPSQHRYGKAVDLVVPSSVSKSAVVRWLYDNAPGVTMTYRRSPHVHFDTGPYHKLACGGCGSKRVTRTKIAEHR